MGRKRTIEPDAVLDAAEQVVMRDGAARLTLDAVACAARINKASVLYDYKTKQALIKAVLERRLAAHRT
ncbi:MAG: TetR family transcriptional regulator [Alphaproteobacteria bacterium]|nr:TetR family transcriptional regulator [Alphaproteobacteria bacterium]